MKELESSKMLDLELLRKFKHQRITAGQNQQGKFEIES